MTGISATPDSGPDPLLQRRDRAFGRGAKLFYDEPLHLARGEGASLFGADGRRYVDMYNNVPCVGHAHPRIVEAMARQQATLNTHSRYLSEPAIALAERLTALQRVTESAVFSCSGTEAIEIALRMARMATAAQGIVCTDHTYHGNNTVVGALTNLPAGDTRHADIRSIPFPETLRPIAPGEAAADAYVARLQAAIDDLKASGQGFAALILCPILANEGLPDIPEGFMAKAAALVRAEGGLIIADEVQAGYGRSGTWWGYDHVGLPPDIVVTGKPMGAGLPLAATCARREVVEQFRAETRYFNTFAASPLQGAVGCAVLDVIEEEDLVEQARTLGAELKAALQQRLGHTPGLLDVRGKGLFLAAEFVDAEGNPDAAQAFALVFNNCVKIRPPLVLPREDALAFLDAFDRVTAHA
jgi:4-aminobutyrate aminotransferase-like enzyme